MIQFNRNARVDIYVKGVVILSIKDLKISFHVAKDMTKEYNKATVEVTNLSKESRDLINGIGQHFDLLVGYGGEYERIFYGDLVSFEHEFSDTEVVTKFGCVNKTLAEKKIAVFAGESSNVLDIIKKLCKDNAIPLATRTLDKLKTKIMSGGFSSVGKVKDIFDELSGKLGSVWSNHDDVIYFIEQAGFLEKKDIYLSERSGLIGVPTKIDDITTVKKQKPTAGRTKVAPGYVINSLLQPKILPGFKISVESKKANIKGDVIVYTVEHKGDTHGSDWTTTMRVVLA